MTATINWQTFDPKRLVYSTQAVTNRNNGKMIRVEYLSPETNERVPVRWQTPRLKIPFGVSQYPPPGQATDQPIKYSLPQNLTDEEYKAFLLAMDERNIEAVLEYQTKWFPGKPPKSRELVADAYVPLVKPVVEGKDFPATTRFKIPVRMKTVETRFWNEQRQQIAFSDVSPHSDAVTINEFANLWFIQKQWGAQTQVNQAKIYNTSDRYDSYGIDDDMDVDGCPVKE